MGGERKKASSMHMRDGFLELGENTLALPADALIGRLELRLWGHLHGSRGRLPEGGSGPGKTPPKKETATNPPPKKIPSDKELVLEPPRDTAVDNEHGQTKSRWPKAASPRAREVQRPRKSHQHLASNTANHFLPPRLQAPQYTRAQRGVRPPPASTRTSPSSKSAPRKNPSTGDRQFSPHTKRAG